MKSDPKEFWNKFKAGTLYNKNSGSGIVTSLKLENGDLASEQDKQRLIEDKYTIMFDAEPEN